MTRRAGRVFSLEPGPGALSRVIAALMDGTLLDLPMRERPEALADLVVYLPNKRLRHEFEAALRRDLGPRPVILPQMRLLGAPGADPDLGADEALDELAAGTRVMGAAERRFALLPLVRAWRQRVAEGAALDSAEPAAGVSLRETLALAGALGGLIDEMGIAGLPLDRLAHAKPRRFDPARHDIYWSYSAAFLKIAAEEWPAILARAGAQDARVVALAQLEAEAKALEQARPATPMLVLGSTGSVSATARLMAAIARLDHGAVVLPGLDTRLSREDFARLGPKAPESLSLATRFGHPQGVLKATLATLGIERDAVEVLAAPPARAARLAALSDMMRPAESVALWRDTRRDEVVREALAGIRVIEAQHEQEEALSIALAMRETLDTPGARVALVTPDRTLARRVQIELRRWGIEAADAAGQTLRESEAGTFALLLLEAAAEAPGALMALLAHPLARLGFERAKLAALAQALDLSVLRGHLFPAGMALPERVTAARLAPQEYAHPSVARLDPLLLDALPALAAALEALLAPFRPGAQARTLAGFAEALVLALEAATRDEAGLAHLGAGPDGGALRNLLDDLALRDTGEAVSPAALPGALALLLHETVLPPTAAGHPRASLLGPYEARLLEADRVILGGLNETQFPTALPEDPFLNRAMREDLGLAPPEWRLGVQAHDFTQLAATPDLILTRARRAGEAPSLPSRFLRRLAAYAQKDLWETLRAGGEHYLALARALDAPTAPPAPVSRPCPVPQAPRLPERIRVTEVETLRRDPYAFYARHILKLVPLDPPGAAAGARERGTLLHRVLELYAREEPPREPDVALAHLERVADAVFEPLRHETELYHTWRARLRALAPSFIVFDRAARDAGRAISVEQKGRAVLETPSARLTLVGKADRIERDADGTLRILDYKSGAPPSRDDVEKQLAPQLPLLAAMAQRGCLGPAGAVESLSHATIGGSAFEEKVLPGGAPPDLAGAMWDLLLEEIEALASGATGFCAQRFPKKGTVGDYDALSRRALWDDAGEDEAEEEA